MRAAFQSLRNAITPTLRFSQFLEGRLTPDEFTVSGNALITSYPSFRWASPKCLVMENIASRRRVADVDDGTVEEVDGAAVISTPASQTDTYEDIDNYVDPAVNSVASADVGAAVAPSLRLYDMFIVYDNYYACPRTYLAGRGPNGQPLSPDEMMQDVMQDYVDRTATIERHPLYPDRHTISIHPCRHTQAMKRILEGMSVGRGSSLTVESYMPAFLKMLASMLPTLEYDYTAAIRL
jgi:hypothetical protein